MKHIILILSVCFSFIAYSCTDDRLSDYSEKEDNSKCSVTFSLSKSDDNSDLNVVTRSKGSVITNDYTVVFYLFQKNETNSFVLKRKEIVKPPLYTIENLEKKSTYKYVFVTTKNENAAALDAMDFSSVKMTPNSITLPSEIASVDKASILENCYISYIDDYTNKIPTYKVTGSGAAAISETITINKDLEIYGCGSLFIPGSTSSTPLDVFMERQFGVVKFVYADAQVGDEMTCSFSTDYYRLYLSQMVRDDDMNYTSDNFAIMPDNSFSRMGITYTAGDYYSASGILNGKKTLPIITKTVTLDAAKNSIDIYIPYTTAKNVGADVDDNYKANYIRFSGTGGPVGSLLSNRYKGSVLLSVKKADGTTKEFKRAEGAEAVFPIYRNAKTVFTTVGNDYLQITLGNGGIGLDGDSWDGDN